MNVLKMLMDLDAELFDSCSAEYRLEEERYFLPILVSFHSHLCKHHFLHSRKQKAIADREEKWKQIESSRAS